MIGLVWLFRSLLAVLLVLGISGCVPAGQSELDEEREPHFLAGKKAINTMDYRGAIEEFEKALEVNPRNSKAHSQLGWLYEEKEADAATAIYHYERYLKLRPGSDNAEVIRQRIMNCKQDLAKTVLPLPITPGMQRQFEQVLDENKRLKEENEKWKAYFAGLQLNTNVAPTAAYAPRAPAPTPAGVSTGAPISGVVRPAPGASRTHVVQSGETLSSISRRYGVRLSAVLAANPGLDARRLRVGQPLKIPRP